MAPGQLVFPLALDQEQGAGETFDWVTCPADCSRICSDAAVSNLWLSLGNNAGRRWLLESRRRVWISSSVRDVEYIYWLLLVCHAPKKLQIQGLAEMSSLWFA